ncbi:guanine deaminase [Aliiroseovarius crassostreae]|uniref:guanine deaminase n=1 Tax=Aliiroseovarius crassostreae TaxID=154981 RepID=UPI0021AFC198|nr:guanine deaminase [Aliiroseovarius crassostreae]UWP89502.1 guanine deaminase [Aliiroseovarius crassostreae]UWP92639.1 guanine deaminase [Aliiroseovarius crassostreae]
MQLLLGQTLTFSENPFTTRPDEATRHHARGGVVIDAGKIIAVGPADDMRAQYPQAQVTDYGNALISPGFIDAHAHYPQTAIIASWGKRLIDWLNSYTFPEESRFADRPHAQSIAESYFDLVTAAGTTTTVSYCTIHPESVDAYFSAAQNRGLRVFGGKTCMDRNAPDTLTDTAQSAYEDSKALLEEWHGVDRLSYVITPRFAPTSTPEQLDALGTLWREHPDLLMQTHISEQHEEIAWVQDLFPDSRDYLDVYEKFGLAREGALFGHAIHLTERERDRLHEMKASLIHCPTSNMFIGSGLFDMAGLMATGQRIGLATDTGGGSSFSMLRTMAAAYEVGQLSGTALHPAQLWWLATAGSAQSLLMGDVIGTLAPGYEADLAVIDLSSTPAIAQRAARAEDLWQALFPTIMMGDDRAVTSVWAGGRKLY